MFGNKLKRRNTSKQENHYFKILLPFSCCVKYFKGSYWRKSMTLMNYSLIVYICKKKQERPTSNNTAEKRLRMRQHY